jgi:MFS transporter, DHA2 family, multidrug resistance protein
MGTLGADINVAEWVLTGYMLSMASILPAAGWLSERFGYKKIYFLSLLVFTAGSFMCGSSSTIGELIFWRVRMDNGHPIHYMRVSKECDTCHVRYK